MYNLNILAEDVYLLAVGVVFIIESAGEVENNSLATFGAW